METDVLIVGSGAGGATVAKELTERGKSVMVLEKGRVAKRLGTARGIIGCYDGYGMRRSKEGTLISRTLMVGGTTMVALGCGVRVLEEELRALSINLDEEFTEAERELKITPVPEWRIGDGTKRIMEASKELGYDMHPMSKFINFDRCKGCGLCLYGCPNGAKWTAQRYLNQAKSKGAKVLTNVTVKEIQNSNGEVTGVKGIGPDGRLEISADVVVLAAGGIGTPVILQRAGISNAGENLFVDLLNMTYGLTKDVGMKSEQGMAAIIDDFRESRGFILTPCFFPWMALTLRLPLTKMSWLLNRDYTLGIMTKIKDDCVGRVNADGSIEKPVTANDSKKLNEGASITEKILTQAGAEPKSIYTSRAEGAHPGGTAAIGKVTNAEQETEISRLFVSDASVMPTAPGSPPILTIVALSKRLGKKLATEFL
jgi:choline dehydrogenase-like flavoprotein